MVTIDRARMSSGNAVPYGADTAELLDVDVDQLTWSRAHNAQPVPRALGAGDRLDFTVIGPDVNLTSRIERLCRELDRNLIMSEDFVRYLDSPVFEIGHFRLRGFSRMQLLFGLSTA